MTLFEIEENIQKLQSKQINQEFVFDLLLAFGIPKSSITRLKKGSYNQSKDETEVLWKGKLYFKYTLDDLHLTIEELRKLEKTSKFEPRFIIVTDNKQLLSIDTKTNETLDIPIKDLANHFTFFLPWAGMEKTQHSTESLADIKAAIRMARLYDEIVKINPYPKSEKDQLNHSHNLNVFFSRLLFCFFAEDTGIFSNEGLFTTSISSFTQEDGSDLSTYLFEVFDSLNKQDKTNFAKHLAEFPYVNGGLFAKRKQIPQFNRKSRRLILECGELNWSQINPDIFGSMIQAVVRPDDRNAFGMHYTSVENIMKVINPLFVEKLNKEYEKSKNDEKKLNKLLRRIYQIKVFDPACGSGNFLIIAYKELRKLEHKILERIANITGTIQMRIDSGIRLDNFCGIEIDDFAAEVAQLSLWLAKHQMNLEFENKFGISISLIPLTESGNIVCENAARIDWDMVCPKNRDDEVYLIGNPPYLGSSKQDEAQKEDFLIGLPSLKLSKNLDYISIWMLKGSAYIADTNSELAFVSTNSICQGQHVAILWPHIFSYDLEISFAYPSFKWTNNAKGNAGVTCIIVGLRRISNEVKYIYQNNLKKNVKEINPYLTDSNLIILDKRKTPLAKLPIMSYGSKPVDGGHLILSKLEKESLIRSYPESVKYIKKLFGADEFLYDRPRWCLWLQEKDLSDIKKIGPIWERVENVKKFRLNSKKSATRKLANVPFQFAEIRYAESASIIIPSVTSEDRDYIPIGYLNKDVIVTNRAHVILNAPVFIFGLISSRLHMIWTLAVAGKLETRINYSSSIVYNNFPVPNLSDKQKKMIENHVYEVLGARENYSEKILAQLYDPENMPEDLKNAHRDLDFVVESCYSKKMFNTDEERLSHLFNLYEQLANQEKEN